MTGLGNVLTGYQCGTVYKPIYEEAQAAVAIAVYLRASMTPPSTLVNGQTKDTTSNKEVASVLLTPEWVTTTNMDSTVIADGFVRASQLCNPPYQLRRIARRRVSPEQCGISWAAPHFPGRSGRHSATPPDALQAERP